MSEIFPTGALSIEDTAKKDVPTGVKYKIINISDLPSDLTLEMLGSLTLLQILRIGE